MPIDLETATARYVKHKNVSARSRSAYAVTMKKWGLWGEAKGLPLSDLTRSIIADFLNWTHARAIEEEGTNPGRTTNKASDHLRAVLSWAWEQDIVKSLPRFPRQKPHRDVAGRHYLTKQELDALYFATFDMRRPRGWRNPYHVGRYWRAALVVFFNYGVDTGTVWTSTSFHEPVLWRHIFWERESPNRVAKEKCRWGWIYYRRIKTGRKFYRPMNRTVHAHIRSIMPDSPEPNEPVFLGGSSRPSVRFQELCELAGIRSKTDPETGESQKWLLKDLRKTCATYYDQHLPESAIEILGHSVGGITYRHYAHRDPLAFRAIMSIPQPPSFRALEKGFDGACPCCRRSFVESSGKT